MTGDPRALAALYERYEAPVFHFLAGLLRDHHQAEDALQETFVRALERLDDVDPEHWRGWLFTVAYHQAMLTKRRQKLRDKLAARSADSLSGQSDDAGPLHAVEVQDEIRRVRALLNRLPPQQREVILQRVYEGKPFREIATTLHCPLNTALARMHEGLKRLRRLWDEQPAPVLSSR
jgi:RNA polymerase sigma-70 factor (ECF subfamily)